LDLDLDLVLDPVLELERHHRGPETRLGKLVDTGFVLQPVILIEVQV
jgi:hypothetical protein